jgi:O-antigen/teichoic acid export membrane protein
VLAFAPLRLGRPALLLALAWLLAAWHALAVESLLLGWVAGSYALVALLFAVWWVDVRRRTRHAPLEQDRLLWHRAARSFAWLAAVNAVLAQADVLILGLVLDEADVGIYNAAARTASLLGLFVIAVSSALAPRISALWARGERETLGVEVSRAAHLAFWPMLAVACAMWIAAPWIMQLFGPEFGEAGPLVLRLLVAGHAASTAFGPVGYLLNLTGHEGVSVRVLSATALAHVVLCLVLASALGAAGAAVSWSVVTIGSTAALHAGCRRALGITPGIVRLSG